MLKEIYPNYICPKGEYEKDFDVTMHIGTGTLPKTKKVKKDMDEEQATKIREENEIIRVERAKQAEDIATHVSLFKRNFLSAPIRQAMKAAIAGSPFTPAEVAYRQDEKFWVINPAKDEVQVLFAINFTNEVD